MVFIETSGMLRTLTNACKINECEAPESNKTIAGIELMLNVPIITSWSILNYIYRHMVHSSCIRSRSPVIVLLIGLLWTIMRQMTFLSIVETPIRNVGALFFIGVLFELPN